MPARPTSPSSPPALDPGPHPGKDAAGRREEGEFREYDPRWLQVHRPPPMRDVPYLPSDEPIVEAMLDLAQVGPGDVLYDLGCGDGRIVIAAARRGARAIGVDVDLLRIRESFDNAKRAGVGHRAHFLRQSFFETDVREATVVTLYLLPSVNVKLRPKLLWELRPGSRVVANYFEIAGWPPDVTTQLHHRTLYKWIIPAWVQGDWAGVIAGPNGRERIGLHLERRYQSLAGTARLAGQNVPITGGKLHGDDLTFTVRHPLRPWPRTRFTAHHDGRCLRGRCQPAGVTGAGAPTSAWAASRR
jgi:precorrin-6B methylase 2